MKKIRIGNDICLNVTLLYNANDQYANINSIKAYIINVSKQDEIALDLQNRSKFVSRFPLEPYADAYSSTPYDIKSDGFPSWHILPNYDQHIKYNGFGINPRWENIYDHIKKRNLTEYLAQVEYTEDRSKVKLFFPAESQLYTGTYNLVVVAKIYDPGYSKNNLRTVTMDYENVFTLVNRSEDGVDGDVTINVASAVKPDSATSVVIKGDAQLKVGEVGMLSAKVYPVGIEDSSVTWYVADKDAFYLAITNKQPNNCNIHAIQLPSGVDQYTATVWAESNYTDGVKQRFDVVISKDFFGDIYVNRGEYQGSPTNGGNVQLTLTNGQQVDVDLSKATGWYEGN